MLGTSIDSACRIAVARCCGEVGKKSVGRCASFGDKVEDTTDTFCVVFSTRLGDDLYLLDSRCRHCFKHLLGVLAEHWVGTSVDIYLKVSTAIYFDVVIAIDSDHRHLTKHFDDSIRLSGRVFAQVVDKFVGLCLDDGLACYDFHFVEHLFAVFDDDASEVGNRVGISHFKAHGGLLSTDGSECDVVATRRGESLSKTTVLVCDTDFDRLGIFLTRINADCDVRLALVE